MVKNIGIKYLLRAFEDGACNIVTVSTALSLTDSLLSVTSMFDAFSILGVTVKEFQFDPEIGTNEQWSQLLKDTKKTGRNLDTLFDKYGIDDDLYDNLYDAITGLEYKNWLIFLYL